MRTWRPPRGKANLNLWLSIALRHWLHEDAEQRERTDTEHAEIIVRFYKQWVASGLIARLILALKNPQP